jgi:sporadic carbohydrate cluster 2OG-Fe(II) oxygenase
VTAPPSAAGFFDAEEAGLIDEFLQHGYLIRPVEDRTALDSLRAVLADSAAAFLSLPPPDDPGRFLNDIHRSVDVDRLNDLRLATIRAFNADSRTRPAYYALARRALAAVVGNELAMQRRVNLSIQLPDDTSSLLPLHADVWSGDAPSEVVLWIPFVDCYASKSMYIVEKAFDDATQARLTDFAGQSAEDLYRAVEPHATFLNVPYGSFLLFTQNLMHGNRINRETETRWSANCRFKGLLTPYADKRLGEFFEPITMRPATRLGLSYRLPEGFDE